MKANCQLRVSTGADHDLIAEVWHASASLPGVGPASMPEQAELRERLAAEIAAGWIVTVAVRAGEILGFVATNPPQSVLAELFIRPDSLGEGLGQALLAHSKAEMPNGFTLHTRSGNVRARRFYEREGLAVLRDGTHPRSGDPITFYGWKRSEREAGG